MVSHYVDVVRYGAPHQNTLKSRHTASKLHCCNHTIQKLSCRCNVWTYTLSMARFIYFALTRVDCKPNPPHPHHIIEFDVLRKHHIHFLSHVINMLQQWMCVFSKKFSSNGRVWCRTNVITLLYTIVGMLRSILSQMIWCVMVSHHFNMVRYGESPLQYGELHFSLFEIKKIADVKKLVYYS